MTNDVTNTFLFFLGAILWQILSHFIRTLMLKYYISNGYYFEFSDENYVYLPDTKLYNMGLSYLVPRRADLIPTVSYLVDLTYTLLLCLGVPVLIFGSFYGDGGIVPAHEIDAKLFLWIAVNFGLAIPLNALRYRKFKHQIKSYDFQSLSRKR